MPRISGARVAWYSGKELDFYLRQRAWHWTIQRNYALSADYCIRLLNRHPKDVLGLVLGEVAGLRTGQGDFTQKCTQSLQESCRRRGVASVAELIATSSISTESGANSSSPSAASCSMPSPADVMNVRAEAVASGPAERGSGEETLRVRDTAPVEFMTKAVRRACLRCASSPLAELVEPQQSVYGRGLYAKQHIAPRQRILAEKPLLAQRYSEDVCAHCLTPLSARGSLSLDPDALGVTCPHCDAESYCSVGCREAAWTGYHICSCTSRNPELAHWMAGMRELLHSRSEEVVPDSVSDAGDVNNAASEARAALSCLTVSKICAMATVQQVHPLSLPGLSCLRGTAVYEPATALSEIGALAVALSAALRQPHLYMEEVLSLFALLQTNEFFSTSGIALYSVLSMLNHSCDPNCTLERASALAGGPSASGHPQSSTERYLVALRPIREGEQLFIDYNAALTTKCHYEDRKALCAQRHFECFCVRCLRRE